MGFKYRIKQHLIENRWQYAVIILLLILGIIAGNYQVAYLETGVKSNLLETIDNYLRGQQADYGSSFVFWTGVFVNQLKTVLVIWFLGLTVLGLPLILALVFVRGFSLGFTIGFLIHEKAGAGVVMTLLSIIPQNLIYIPLIAVWSVMAMNFSIYLVRGRHTAQVSLSRSLAIYTGMLIVCILIVMAGSLIEAYLSPWLLSLML
ncbi:MAG TPA: stage II sporulation protein M [Syntrophomonadaceae bacterium]|nr:stage II sporulation protein M [Syntrophomonadaceae bacterium]HPR92539.1 stage II sporulation protein M [Syntrophomonadaceae bacterium]